MADIDDLKAAFALVMKAANERDLNALAELWHEQIVTVQPFSPFLLQGKAAQRQFFQNLFDNSESIGGAPVNLSFQVIGDVGVVSGHLMLAIKPKDGPLRNIFIRSTFTFAKVSGKWVELVVHHSLMPPGNL